MFHSARLTLTAWYLVIIMLISILFSIAMFSRINNQLNEIARHVQERQKIFSQKHPDNFRSLVNHNESFLDPQTLAKSRTNIIVTLVLINIIILITSGGAGYFLAGRTLRPIKIMMDEQGRFISDASHELKTPLTALRSEIEVYLLGKTHTIKASDKLLVSSLEEVIRLQSLTESLMELTQYEKPNGIIFKKISLLAIVENGLKRVVPLARQKQIVIQNNIGEEVIEGDERSLTELLVILLDNAIKYSPEKSSITINSSPTDHSVAIDIIDHGIGIDKNDIPHLFDRFFRADTSRTNQTIVGYGLGLSIAKQIIYNHHGTISVKSEINKGTTFTIYLPLAHT